jgi:NAD(P)-dependent dehydrogenase (short-subunit alcohol dehydrogenase family)
LSGLAIEALDEAYCDEVAPFGIDVIVIRPGLSRTGFVEAVQSEVKDVPAEQGPCGELNEISQLPQPCPAGHGTDHLP